MNAAGVGEKLTLGVCKADENCLWSKVAVGITDVLTGAICDVA